ncbi:MAG: DMT family transporter [archaeon]
MIHIPILGSLALAAGTIFQKLILIRKKIDIKSYTVLEFLAIILAMSPFVYFFWSIKQQAFEIHNIILFLLIVFLSIIANFLTFYSMKWEKVSNLEPAKVLEPLFVIVLAVIFSFISEELFSRDYKIILPGLIACFALIFSHIKKHHLSLNKYFIAAIFGSFFFAVELILSKYILEFYSPISFYFTRCIAIFLIVFIIFRPKIKKLAKNTKLHIVGVGISWATYRVLMYYGYISLGVVSTTLLLMLGPVFIYIFAWKFLKEKLNWKNIVAAFVIVGCVLYATLM